jgi:hypothetical protein
MNGGTSCAHVGLEADHRVRADVHELVHARQAADDGPVAHVHVAGQRDAVGEHRAVAQAHVVRDVHVGHDPVVASRRG